jgi:hypothetical protein
MDRRPFCASWETFLAQRLALGCRMTTSTVYQAPGRTRPFGVALLAVLIGIAGAILLVGGILVLLLFTALGIAHSLPFAGLGALGGVLLLVLGIVLLAVASGLWHLEMWALVLSFLVFAFLLIGDLLAGPILTLQTFVLALFLVYFFAVRQHFR